MIGCIKPFSKIKIGGMRFVAVKSKFFYHKKAQENQESGHSINLVNLIIY